MRRHPDIPAGTLHRISLTSDILARNRLGDPTRREIVVHVPHGHDGAGLPLLVDLAGYTSGGPAHAGWKNFGENLPERLDRLIHEGTMPPVVVAMPDCFTRLGGNQYVDSAAMGSWATWLTTEMVPAVEQRFGCGGDGRRGVFGKSSGGYGALLHGMKHAGTWSAVACHSGDMAFELCYLPDFPGALRAIGQAGGIEPFVTGFEEGPKYPGGQLHVLMSLAMAATYDPDPDPEAFCGIRLPVDPETCEIIEARWQAWLDWDPVRIATAHGEALAGLKGLWIDCGTRDQYNLLYGARRLTRILSGAGIGHVYEEFDDTHSGIDYRLDRSLPWMAALLAD